jgi:hypothetical protein
MIAAISTAAIATALLTVSPTAHAAIVPTVPLATAANYSVLGGLGVTNTGPSTLNASLGVHPGSAATGFPPGLVNAPGTVELATAVALQAQSDLTVAYDSAAGRPLTGPETTVDLVGQTLQGGVYASFSKGPLELSGALVLDGAGDPNTVFIFQTNSTLITGSGSTITLINGAQACNVFWQVGSSATLGTNSNFVGNILALTSISVTTGVTVQGRALARNASVTLDSDTFTAPSCNLSAPVATTSPSDASGTTAPGGVGSETTVGGNIPGSDLFLPGTGRSSTSTVLVALVVLAAGVAAVRVARRTPAGGR